jgi:hypothetical protein
VRSQTATALYVVLMAAVIAAVDLLFFKNRFWERLTVNVGIVDDQHVRYSPRPDCLTNAGADNGTIDVTRLRRALLVDPLQLSQDVRRTFTS